MIYFKDSQKVFVNKNLPESRNLLVLFVKQDLSGHQIGPYQLIEQIGKGGMAVVYRARRQGSDQDVALKIVAAQYARHPAFIDQFQYEIYATQKLNHPHIVPVLDMGVEKGQPYLVTPYYAGGTLALHIIARPNGLEIKDVVCIAIQVASALDYAHQNGVIHRDLKPGNVFLDDRGNAYLGDFGIAQLIEDRHLEDGPAPGTYEYMPPELAAGYPATPSSDIYALGVMIFEMLVGRRPFPFLMYNREALAEAHEESSTPDIQLWRPDLPYGVRVVVQQALSVDPESRPPQAASLIAALSKAVGLDPADCSPYQKADIPDEVLNPEQVKRPFTPPVMSDAEVAGTPYPETAPSRLPNIPKPPPRSPDGHHVTMPRSNGQPSSIGEVPANLLKWLVGGFLVMVLVVLFLLMALTIGQMP